MFFDVMLLLFLAGVVSAEPFFTAVEEEENIFFLGKTDAGEKSEANPSDDATHEGFVKLQPRGDDEYALEFENRQGTVYKISYLTNEGGIFKYGDDDKDLVFVEARFAEDMTLEQVRQAKDLFNIGILDYVVLTSQSDGPSNALRM